MKWITFKTLHMHDPELDGEASLNPNNIAVLIDANPTDKKQRSEIKTLIVHTAGSFASPQTKEELLQLIEQADSSVPSS